MAFDTLQQRLTKTFRNIQGKGRLSEKNMEDTLKEIRLALLEADVNYRVVKNLLQNIQEKSIGMDVYNAVDPGQLVVKIVHDEIKLLLGEQEAGIHYQTSGLTVLMMVGLQGTGKTTSVGKIANIIKKKHGKNPMIIAADLIRPAAIEQLQVLGQSVGIEVYSEGLEKDAVTTVKNGMAYAQEKGYDTVLIDTAGRLHIDEVLMNELKEITKAISVNEILLTVDAMTGQDIINVASSFHEALDITGLVVTKMDGDARGGGVLSVRSITNVPVKFVGNGEKIDDMDIFYPDRMADRILGMGDIVSLVEQAQEKMDMEEAQRSAKRMFSGEFTMDDMLSQFQQIEKMGSVGSIMKMIPGLSEISQQMDDETTNRQMRRSKAIILSMTPDERKDPSYLRNSHKRRIASGSGTTVSEVTRLISQFEKTKKAMKQMGTLKQGGKNVFGDFLK
ncbi:MAG: signal recognition particle protein [Erysipelotrichaceae bacterium]